MTTFTLQAPGLADLTLSKANGYIVRAFNRTQASIRDVAEDAPEMDGQTDTTTLAGAGSVTFGIRLADSVESFTVRERRLKAFTHGRLRPTLLIDFEDGSAQVVATLSRGRVDAPIDQMTHRDIVAQWVVPSGILESAEEFTAVATASGDPTELGFTFDLTFDLTFPSMDPQGSVQVVNQGDRDAYPLIRLYGPWSDEVSISNETQGKALVFDGTSVGAGDFLEINTRTKTIRLNGNPADSRNQFLVFPDTAWWSLAPGEQRIRFEAETFTAPAQAQIVWRSAYS